MADDERVSIPIGTGTVAGVGAWLLGYFVTYVGTIDLVEEDYRTVGLEWLLGGDRSWQLVGWLYYNAHGVDVRFPDAGGFQTVGSNQNFIAGEEGSLWVLYLLPMLVLFLAGTVVIWRHRAAYGSRTDAAIAGATVTGGYLLCSVVGLVAFAIGVDGEAIRPDPLTGVLLAGVAYPVVFGGLGGFVAAQVAGAVGSTASSRTDE